MTRPAAVFVFLAAAAGAGIVAAIEEINSDYVKHSRGASEIAREEMEADKVLGSYYVRPECHCPQIAFQPWNRRWRTAA